MQLDRPGHLVAGAVDVNAAGDVLAVWRRDGVLYARIRTATGQLLPPQRLGRMPFSRVVHAQLADDRRALVTWGSQVVDEGQAGTGFTPYAAIARHGRFGRAMRIGAVPVKGTGRYVTGPGVLGAFLPPGAITLAWTGYSHGRFVVRAAVVHGTRLGSRQIISDPARDTILADLAFAGDALTALFTEGIRGADPFPRDGRPQLAAATRPAGGTFGPPQQLSDDSENVDPTSPTLAANPANHNLTAAWRQLDRSTAPIRLSTLPAD